jgi:hypothetical protein
MDAIHPSLREIHEPAEGTTEYNFFGRQASCFVGHHATP